MEQQSSKSISEFNDSNKLIGDWNAEFHDAFEEFPFVDAVNSFESDQSVSSSESGSNNDDESTVSVLSEHSPESPSSPSSAGLRHRRLVSQRSCKDSSQSQFFINNPDGLIDFDPRGTTGSSKKYERSWSLKDNDKLIEKLNSSTVRLSSSSDGNNDNDDTDASSAITSVSNGESQSSTVNSPNSVPNFVFIVAELVIKALGFQTQLLTSSITFPIWLIYSSYMLFTDPFGITRHIRNYMLCNASGIWGICYSAIKWILHLLIQKHKPTWKLFFRIGWIILWFTFFGFVLISLLVPAFLLSGIMMKWIVEEPIQIKQQLIFDYTKDTPTAFMPIISCPHSSCSDHNEKSKIESFSESQVIPSDHELQATVSLTLPESDYNRNLGIFQVRVDFLSSDHKPLASTRKPCMLQYKSQHIRLLSTFFKLPYILTGYSSETQTLDIKFDTYTEKDSHTFCSRVIIEQRAEFAKGAGVPEIYAASLTLESQLPFLKRMLWHWKWIIYLWISVMIFNMELLFTVLCCAPIFFPQLRRRGVLVNSNASRNTPRGRS